MEISGKKVKMALKKVFSSMRLKSFEPFIVNYIKWFSRHDVVTLLVADPTPSGPPALC